jgi:hypothetical protein
MISCLPILLDKKSFRSFYTRERAKSVRVEEEEEEEEAEAGWGLGKKRSS